MYSFSELIIFILYTADNHNSDNQRQTIQEDIELATISSTSQCPNEESISEENRTEIKCSRPHTLRDVCFGTNAMLTCYSDEAHIISNTNHVSQLYNDENEYDHVNLRIPNCVLDSSLLYSKPFERDARSQINVSSWNLTLHRNSKKRVQQN